MLPPSLGHEASQVRPRKPVHPGDGGNPAARQRDLGLTTLAKHMDMRRRVIVGEHDEAEAEGAVHRHHEDS